MFTPMRPELHEEDGASRIAATGHGIRFPGVGVEQDVQTQDDAARAADCSEDKMNGG